MAHETGCDSFNARHWGDVVGLTLAAAGTVLQLIVWVVVVALFVKGFDPDKLLTMSLGINGLGNGLTMTGVGIIKLRYNPPTNGNGGPTTSVATSPTIPVA